MICRRGMVLSPIAMMSLCMRSSTESKSLTRGDTAVIIQSKTIESYNARKN